MINPQFDTKDAGAMYAQAFQRFKVLPGFDPQAVLLAEAGVILKTWAGRTPVATASKTDLNSRLALLRRLGLTKSDSVDGGGVTINAGLRGPAGRIWFRTPRGRFQLAGNITPDASSVRWNNIHFKDENWNSILRAGVSYADGVNGYLKRGRLSQGLARQSVIQIADVLGIDLARVLGGGNLSSSAIAKARGAVASTGRAYQNGTGFAGGNDVQSYVQLINRLPYNAKIGMDRTLVGVVSGRAKFIETSYAKGAFASIENVAKSFPNFRVNYDGPQN